MKLTRRFLALLLALSMSLSMVTPAYASEAETVVETEPVVVVEESAAAEVEETEAAQAETEVPEVTETEEPEVIETEAPEVIETEAAEVEETEAAEVEETEAAEVEETEIIEVADAEAAYTAEEVVAGSTEDNPVLLYTNMFSFEGVSGTYAVTVPAGTTYYYALYNAGGMLLTIGDGETTTMTGNMMKPDTFDITNDGEAEQEYILALSYPVGHAMNPQVLSGSTYETAVLELGDFDGYFYTFTAESDGTVKMYLDYGVEDADIVVTDQNSKQYTLSGDGVDNYGLELSIEVAAGDVLTINVGDTTGTSPAREIGWSFNFVYPEGSEQNPIYPEWEWNEDYTKATATVKVAKKSSVWVTVNGGDMLLAVNGKSVELVPTINAYGFEAFNVELSNTTKKAKTFTLVQTYAEGARENPKVLEGELTGAEISLAEGDDNGYFYSYTVPEDCTYTFYIGSITEGVEGDISIYNINTYESKSLVYDGVDNYGLEVSMDANAGDVLQINVMVQPIIDEYWNYTYPAADISWTALAAYPAGSQKNPINPEWAWNEAWTEATASVTVPAGTTQWFNAGMGEIVVTVDGTEVALESVNMGRGTSSIFSITNETEAEVTYALGLGFAVGTRENPEIVSDPSKFVVSLAKDDTDGRFYTYYNRAAKGTLTFKGKSAKKGVGFDIVLSKVGSYETFALSESSDGTVSIDVAPWDQIIIQVVAEPNKNWVYPAAKITVTSTFEYPLGSQLNPDKLVIGENAGSVEEGSWDGYLFTWTAPEDGELFIQMGENETGWTYTVNNLTTNNYGEAQWSDTGSSEYAVMVSKGDEVQVVVNTYDPNSWNNPAGTVKFNASFTVFEEMTSGKSTTLKFINPSTGKKVAGNKVNWSIDGVYVYDPNGEEVEYTDTSAYATIKNGKLKTFKCGDRVNVIINASLKSDPSVSVKYHVVLLPATNILSIWSYNQPAPDVWEWQPMVGYWEWNLNGITLEDDLHWDLEAFSYPSNASQDVKWKSSNKKVITIDEDGIMRPVWDAKNGSYKTGTVTITATAADGSGKKASFKIKLTKWASYIEVSRKDGEALVDIPTNWYYEENPETGEYEQIVTQSRRGTYAEPGTKIELKADVDPNASVKGVVWECYSDYAKISKSGVLSINKNAPDETWIFVYAYTKDYRLYDQILVIVQNAAPGVEIYGDYQNPHFTSTGESEGKFDVSGVTSADEIPSLKLEGYVMNWESSGLDYDLTDWKISSDKIASLEVVPYWYDYDEETGTGFENYDMESKPEWAGIQYQAILTPKWNAAKNSCYTGSVTVTATASDGETKASYKVTITKLVTSIEIATKNGKNMGYGTAWDPEYDWDYENQVYIGGQYEGPVVYATAGDTVTLVGTTNAGAANKKLDWFAYSSDAPGAIKSIKNGKLTINKNVGAESIIWVVAQSKDGTWLVSKIPVIVAPRATNVHARIILNDKLLYTSNTTRDWSIAEDGEKLEVSALVYPFDASQSVSWTSSNKKIANIVEEKDEDGTVHTYIVFTGTKTGKVKFTATSNDGSKEKATFTLVVGK